MCEWRLTIPSINRLLEGGKEKSLKFQTGKWVWFPASGREWWSLVLWEQQFLFTWGPGRKGSKPSLRTLRVALGLWWFGNCRVNLKTAVCHYFHYTFSRVPIWLVNSEQIFLCWGMGAAAQRGRIWESSLLATGSPVIIKIVKEVTQPPAPISPSSFSEPDGTWWDTLYCFSPPQRCWLKQIFRCPNFFD